MSEQEQKEDEPFVITVGPLVVDVPRTLGYFGGIAAVVALELIAPEIGLIIAAVPLVKLLKRKHARKAERAIGGVFEGAMKPIGGDAEGVVRPRWLEDEKKEQEQREEEGEPALAH